MEDLPTDFSETELCPSVSATAVESGESDAKADVAAAAAAADADSGQALSSFSRYRIPPSLPDPLSSPHCDPSPVVREGDHVILLFGDGRRLFAQCVSTWKGRNPPVKINKRSYPTTNLVGLPYGSVLEVGKNALVPLPDGEDIVPDANDVLMGRGGSGRASPASTAASNGGGGAPGAASKTTPAAGEAEGDSTAGSSISPSLPSADNRHLVDTNTAQNLRQRDIEALRDGGAHGSDIVARLVGASATFGNKTEFSQRKYIVRKQMKHQPRCRVVRCTAHSLCDAWFRKDPRRVLNLREDSLAQLLSYSNARAGSKVLVFEQTQGIITGALAQRMGGYGKVLSLFTATQTSYRDMMARYNLTFAEGHSVKWLHAGEVFGDEAERPVMPKVAKEERDEDGGEQVADANAVDYELDDRLMLRWPCPLQDHTRNYLTTMPSDGDRSDFLSKRCARFARKLTRHTTLEGRSWLYDELPDRPCDSLVLATRYDPTQTLLEMMPFLAPSCPFVVFSEFVEPLAECFRELQRRGMAVNLRLTDAWMRDYQVLPGRTHPSMSMSQSGGYLLTGLKLCGSSSPPRTKEDVEKQDQEELGKRQRPHQRSVGDTSDQDGEKKRKKR